jgi:peptidoglycan/LPS O-acetylase OafA/YrhL
MKGRIPLPAADTVASQTPGGSLRPEAIPNLRSSHLPSLDGIRALAVLFVVQAHYVNSTWLPKGATGVMLFFVLSGFLITWLLMKEHAATGAVSLRDFYARRARRILPALAIALPFSIAAWLYSGERFVWLELWACLGFVSNYYYIATHMQAPNAMAVTWSLAVEEQFYLLWPVMFVTIRKRWIRVLVRIVAALIVCGWIYRFVAAFVFHADYWRLYYAFEMRFDHLLMGCLLAIVVHRYPDWRPWRRLLSARAMLATMLLFFAAAEAERWMGDRWRFGLAFAFEPILVALILLQSIALGDSAAQWLNWRPLALLGRWSYAVYLLHLPCFYLAAKFVTGLRPRCLLAFSLTVLFSAASYYLVESPLRKRRHGVEVS